MSHFKPDANLALSSTEGTRAGGGGPTVLAGHLSLDWFEHAPGFVAFLEGEQFLVAFANDAYKRLLGCADLAGRPLFEAVPELLDQGVLALCESVTAKGERYAERGRRVRVRNALDGTSLHRYVDFVIEPVAAGADASVIGLLVQGCDVTIEMISQRDLLHSLTHDALTGLPTYALFRDRLEQAIKSAGRRQRIIEVAAIDIDIFKRVNTWLGHDAGDSILRELAQRIALAAGPLATVARETGDKFLLLFETDHRAGQPALMRAVMNAVVEPQDYQGQVVRLSCCAGVVTVPPGESAADAVMAGANRALDRAKLAGPGSIRQDDTPPNEGELQRFRLGFALRDAIASHALEVHYQPQVDLGTGAICAVEALVRWTTEDGEKVSPLTLIQAAEECGLIGELGDWVLHTACRQAAQWHQLGFTTLRVAVNLSARQFAMRGLADTVKRALRDSALPASCLDLELTEGVLMNDVAYAIACMHELKQIGVRLSLDDFGTGYSSLAYLQRFPLDVLKVDQSFVQQLPAAAKACAIVDAIITMGHSLGMRVIAEGVESAAQCNFLARQMCDEVQGYYLSMPQPAEAITALLRRGRALPESELRFTGPAPVLLLVGDGSGALAHVEKKLRHEDYHTLSAGGPNDALRILGSHRVDIVLEVHPGPGMTAMRFMEEVRRSFPRTLRIVVARDAMLPGMMDAMNAGTIHKLLTLSIDDALLRNHIEDAFAHAAMMNDNRLLRAQANTANQLLSQAKRQLDALLCRQSATSGHSAQIETR